MDQYLILQSGLVAFWASPSVIVFLVFVFSLFCSAFLRIVSAGAHGVSFDSGRCLLIFLSSLHSVSCIDSTPVIDSPLSLICSLISGDWAFVFCSGISWILFRQVSLHYGFSSCFIIDLVQSWLDMARLQSEMAHFQFALTIVLNCSYILCWQMRSLL